jgi:hypothetical protein
MTTSIDGAHLHFACACAECASLPPLIVVLPCIHSRVLKRQLHGMSAVSTVVTPRAIL